MRAVRGHGQPLVEDPVRLDGVRAVGVDETAFLAATGARHTVFVTGIVDLTGRPSPPVVVRDLAAWRSGTWRGHRLIISFCVDSERSGVCRSSVPGAVG